MTAARTAKITRPKRRLRKTDYKYKTEPREHQRTGFSLSRDVEYFALFMEQGTGKSKLDIDGTAWSHERGLIDAWVILAPAGVHLNWYRQEIPKHLPDRLDARTFCWNSSRAQGLGYQQELEKVLTHRGLAIVCMNIEAALTEAGREVLSRMLRGRACKLTIDESTIIGNHKTQRTKLLLKAGPLAAQRRILTGTPAVSGPLRLYSQCAFLDPTIFGYSSFYTFSHHYAEWEKKTNWSQGRDYEEMVSYKNMDELAERLGPISYRVLKKDCLDLPAKIYMAPRYFELTREQRALYNRMRDEFLVELEGTMITARLALTRLLRLQQMTCGYLPGAEDGKLQPIPGPNRRLETQLAQIEETDPRKMIIWARFTRDLDYLQEALSKLYGEKTIARFDGTVKKQEDRDEAKRTFQDMDSPVRYLLSNPQAGGRGHDLFAAEAMSYYSNSFSAEQRIQSEDRVHRDGLQHSFTISDIVGVDTVDEHIVETLRNGIDVADALMAKLPDWLGV